MQVGIYDASTKTWLKKNVTGEVRYFSLLTSITHVIAHVCTQIPFPRMLHTAAVSGRSMFVMGGAANNMPFEVGERRAPQ